jgi:hypothetical protein
MVHNSSQFHAAALFLQFVVNTGMVPSE